MNVRSVTVFKKQREVGVYRLGAISKLFARKGMVYPLRVFLQVVCDLQCYLYPPTPPPPPPPPCKLTTLCNLADGLLVGPFISEFCCVQCMVAPLSTGISFTNACNPITHVSPMTEHPWN